MGKIHVAPNPTPEGPALKIEVRDCPPAENRVYYADDYEVELKGWIWVSPPRLIPKTPAAAAPADPAAAAANPLAAFSAEELRQELARRIKEHQPSPQEADPAPA